MNPDKLIPWKVARWGGLVTWDDPTQLPNGIGLIVQNMQFLAESVKTRWGFQMAMQFMGLIGGVTGFDFLNVLGVPGVTSISAIFSDAGMLFTESPAGSGTLIPLDSPALPTGAAMQTAKAYNRIFMVFSNLLAALGESLVYDAATQAVLPITPNVIGAAWNPGIYYQVGDLVKPLSANGKWFRCTVPGIASSTEPVWPDLYGYFNQNGFIAATASDLSGGHSQWEEWTPAAEIYLPQPQTPISVTHNPGGGSIQPGVDVYLQISYITIGIKESPRTPPIVFVNTSANDQLTYHFEAMGEVPGPPDFPEGGPRVPRWLADVILHPEIYNVIALNLYIADVVTGSPPPAEGGYRAGTGQLLNSNIVLNTLIGTPPFRVPAATVIRLDDPGFMPGIFTGEFGTRNMIVLREDTNGALSPVDPNAIIPAVFGGGAPVNIYFSIARDGAGLVTAGVLANAASAPLIPGITVAVANILVPFTGTPDPSFDGTFTILTAVNTPAGSNLLVLTWQSTTLTPVTYSGPNGTITPISAPRPIAFLPPPGPNTALSIAAFTAVGIGISGPYFYLNSAEPASPFTANILSLNRSGGVVTAQVDNAQAFQVGSEIVVRDAGQNGFTPDPSFDGAFVVGIISGNTLTWPQVGAADDVAGMRGTISLSQILPTESATSNSFSLNFDDTSLPQGVEVTDELNAIVVPPAIDISYLPSTRRMCYVSDKFPSQLIFSEPDQPWHVDGINALLGVETSNGQPLCGAREVANGQIVAIKRRGGYQIVPTADVPAAYGINRLWSKHGPASARGIGKTENGDSLLDFVVFVDPDSGLYKYPSTLGGSVDNLDWLSWELTKGEGAMWDRVNREAAEQIWVVVDDVAREVKIGLPLDGATTPSHILTMNYFNGWDQPLQETMSGQWVYSRSSRRWNLDPVPTRCAGLADRTFNPPVLNPNTHKPETRVNTRQLLYGLGGLVTNMQAIVQQVNYVVGDMNPPPTLPFGPYYAQLAAVKAGKEVGFSQIFGNFDVGFFAGMNPFYTLFEMVSEGSGTPPDSWNLYFGPAPNNLNQVVNFPGNVASFIVTGPGNPAVTPNGSVTIDYQQPDVYNDNGLGIDSQYKPAYVNDELLSILRFALMTGEVRGSGNLYVMPMNDDGEFLSAAKIIDLDDGNNVHFKRTLRPPSDEHLSLLLANSDIVNGIPPLPDTWFELHDLIIWYRKLWSSRRK